MIVEVEADLGPPAIVRIVVYEVPVLELDVEIPLHPVGQHVAEIVVVVEGPVAILASHVARGRGSRRNWEQEREQ